MKSKKKGHLYILILSLLELILNKGRNMRLVDQDVKRRPITIVYNDGYLVCSKDAGFQAARIRGENRFVD